MNYCNLTNIELLIIKYNESVNNKIMNFLNNKKPTQGGF